MAGMLGLLSHIIVPAKQLGLLAAVGIGWALLLSLLLLPAILTQLKKRTTSIFNTKIPGQSKILARIGKKVTKHPKRIIASTLVLIVFACIGITQLRVDGNTENFFGKKHPVRISSKIINDHFGGSQSLLILFSGDIKAPGILEKMDYYKKELENFPGVGNIISMADVIKEMSKAIYDENEKGYNMIPGSREAVAQYLALYSMSGDPDDFEQIVDFPYENAQMIIRLDNGNSTQIKEVVRKINELTKNDKNVKRIGGYGYVTANLINTIIRGQVLSLSLSVIVVGLLIMLIFRSVRAGLITGITLLAATILLFGLMGFLGIPLDAATAMLSSVMIGVGVDYTIHFLWRYKEERKLGLGYNEAVIKTLATTGRGITFNALSVIFGFSALLLSSFLPIKFFGFLIMVSIFSCLASALILVPAICIVLKPRFLEPGDG
jgi:predicted RND superfamily exporter protein